MKIKYSILKQDQAKQVSPFIIYKVSLEFFKIQLFLLFSHLNYFLLLKGINFSQNGCFSDQIQNQPSKACDPNNPDNPDNFLSHATVVQTSKSVLQLLTNLNLGHELLCNFLTFYFHMTYYAYICYSNQFYNFCPHNSGFPRKQKPTEKTWFVITNSMILVE